MNPVNGQENPQLNQGLGCVVIGRNEARRLSSCLKSVLSQCSTCVYVDSGSRDDSVELARSMGVPIVELDTSDPFTAARARNEGVRFLRANASLIEFVQFVDGDSEIVDGWMRAGVESLRRDEGLAIVFGGTRERSPEASLYNRLADVEWRVPIGEANACGGVSMMKISAFESVGGFDQSLIAGEEPELCHRLRSTGLRIEHVEREMMVHDLDMTRFGQWWNRSKRSGYAVARSAHKYRGTPGRYRGAELRRILVWGALVPVVSIGAALPSIGLSLILLLAYVRPILGSHRFARNRGAPAVDARLYAAWCTIGKFPECVGVFRYAIDRVFRRRARLIEHK